MCNLTKLALAACCCFCCVAAVGQDQAADAYERLVSAMKGGAEIKVDFEAGAVIQIEGAQRRTMKGGELATWVAEVIGSPSVAESIQRPLPEQGLVLKWSAAAQRLLSYPKELRPSFIRWYGLHLRSPDAATQAQAYERLRWERIRRNEFESALDAEGRNALLDFAKKHPATGTSDEISFWFQNVITMVGMTEARKDAASVLESLAGKVPGFEFSRKVALARLGDAKTIQEITEQYERAAGTTSQARLAAALGQISTAETLRLLARDLRNDAEIDGMGFNQFVLGGLCLAKDWPDENARFVKVGMFDQADFDAAEAWCVKKFDIKWDKPKPPLRQVKRVRF